MPCALRFPGFSDVQTKLQGAQFASALMLTQDVVAGKEGGSLF
jgi:hypothetical protein